MISPTDSPASVSERLAGANPVILATVLAQLTGDEGILAELKPHVHGAWDHMADVPDALEERIRAELARFLCARDANGAPLAEMVPDDAKLHRMMNACVGETVPEEYVPMLKADMGLAPEISPSVLDLAEVAPEQRRDFRVAVIGAGIGGICTAIGLEQLGLEYSVYEKNETVGGTWFENSYPGSGVDTPNHFYSYSFEPNHDWTRYFAKRDELQAYLEHCTDKYGVRDRIAFETEVRKATWDEATQRWTVTLVARDGTTTTTVVNAVISAVGQLNRPNVPDIPGLDTFQGPVFHTAQWNHDVALEGARVAVIGTGASGAQVVPAIAPEVSHLTVFQRSPHWFIAHPSYTRDVEEGKKWALKNVPFYANWYRFQLFWASADAVYPSLQVDPNWDGFELSINAANQQMREMLTAQIEEALEGHPELIAQTVPQFPPFGKRMLRGTLWYEALKRDNVTLVTEPIDRVGPDGVRSADGTEHPADVLVLATGFAAARMLAPMSVTGRRGETLRDIWGDEDPRAYLGITVPAFPNFFMIFGPNTVLAHGGSAIFHTECQVRYVLESLRTMLEGGFASMECREDVHDEYNVAVDAIHSNMIWAHPGVSSWYKNSRGRVVMTTPWRLVEYWKLTLDVEPKDYIWRTADADVTSQQR